jgi:hypothetical protein
MAVAEVAEAALITELDMQLEEHQHRHLIMVELVMEHLAVLVEVLQESQAAAEVEQVAQEQMQHHQFLDGVEMAKTHGPHGYLQLVHW